jgi:hypothetical protein
MATKTKSLLLICLISALFIFGSVGSVQAAPGNESSLNIRDNLDTYINDLDPIAQEPITWVVENFFLIVVIVMVLLVWFYGAQEASAKRSNNASGTANAQNQQEHVAKKFIWSVVFSVLILFIAAKYLI